MSATSTPVQTSDREEAKGVLYKTLNRTHPSYDPEFYEEIDDLYIGGYRIQKKNSKYLPAMVNEHQRWHDVRKKTAGFQPYMSQVIDQFVAELFGQPLNVQPAADADNPDSPGENPDREYYDTFALDADGAGNPFVDVMRSVMTTALKKGPLLVAIDAPELEPGADPPTTKLQEKLIGLDKLYVYDLPPEDLIDWEVDRLGQFVWCTIHKAERPRKNPKAERNTIVETWTTWEMEAGFATWTRYSVEYSEDKKPDERTIVPEVGSGTTSFKRIPVIRRILPDGFCIGARLGPMQREHYQRRSCLIGAESRSLIAIPVVALGSEIGAMGGELPATVQQDPSRGVNPIQQFERAGFMVTGAGDKIYFAEPGGHCYDLVDRQLEALREAMLQVNHQMSLAVKPSGKSVGRSGASKAKDGENTEKVLRALGHEVREFASVIYDTIAKARGEDVVWAAHGLDTFESDDRKEMLEEAVVLEQVLVNIPSETFRSEFVYQAAKKLMPGLGAETMSQIRLELIKNHDEIQERAEILHEQQVAMVEATKLSGAGGGGAGGGAMGGGGGGGPTTGSSKAGVGKRSRPGNQKGSGAGQRRTPDGKFGS